MRCTQPATRASLNACEHLADEAGLARAAASLGEAAVIRWPVTHPVTAPTIGGITADVMAGLIENMMVSTMTQNGPVPVSIQLSRNGASRRRRRGSRHNAAGVVGTDLGPGRNHPKCWRVWARRREGVEAGPDPTEEEDHGPTASWFADQKPIQGRR